MGKYGYCDGHHDALKKKKTNTLATKKTAIHYTVKDTVRPEHIGGTAILEEVCGCIVASHAWK